MCALAKHFHSHFCAEKIFLLYLLNGEEKNLKRNSDGNAFGNQFKLLLRWSYSLHFLNPLCDQCYGISFAICAHCYLSEDTWITHKNSILYECSWKWHSIDKCVLKCWWKLYKVEQCHCPLCGVFKEKLIFLFQKRFSRCFW